jgi:hypothetical protein
MKPEKEVKWYDLLREFNRQNIRYLIIGRRAVILYGGPVLTADYDLWINPIDKKKTLSLLSDELGFELSDSPDTKKPIVSGFSGMKKFDLFFQKSIRNIENVIIEFEECYKKSILKRAEQKILVSESLLLTTSSDLKRLENQTLRMNRILNTCLKQNASSENQKRVDHIQ